MSYCRNQSEEGSILQSKIDALYATGSCRKLAVPSLSSNVSDHLYFEIKGDNTYLRGDNTSGYYSCSETPAHTAPNGLASDRCCYQNLDGVSHRSHRNVPMSSSCLTTRNKLILLCCCAALVAFISSIMVINAFFKWSSKSSAPDSESAVMMVSVTNYS